MRSGNKKPLRGIRRHPSPMSRRRTFIVGAAGALLAGTPAARLPADATETSLRDALRRCVEAWNRHDVPAWSQTLTEDVRYSSGVDPYRLLQGRPAVAEQIGELVRATDLAWDIVRLRMRSD